MNIESILQSNESRCNFILGLIYLAKADGFVDEAEKGFFTEAALGLKLDENSIAKIKTFWESTEIPELPFESELEKRFFLREALQLCAIDNKYCEAEQKAIAHFASQFGVDPKILAKMEEWVSRGLKWRLEGDILLTEGI